MFKIAAIVVALSLAACGMKGALVLPPGPAPEPLLGNPKPAQKTTPSDAKPAKGGEDVSTDTSTKKP